MALDQFHDSNALFTFCAANPQGLTTDELAVVSWTDQMQLLSMPNQLLANGRLSITQVGAGKLLFKAVDHRLVGLDSAHMAVYQLLGKRNDKGPNDRLLKVSSRLQPHTITKITKELMQRRLIKEVKHVQNKNRKVFMLYDVEPAPEVSGGSWYHDGEFAANWVEQSMESARVTGPDMYCLGMATVSPCAASVEKLEQPRAMMCVGSRSARRRIRMRRTAVRRSLFQTLDLKTYFFQARVQEPVSALRSDATEFRFEESPVEAQVDVVLDCLGYDRKDKKTDDDDVSTATAQYHQWPEQFCIRNGREATSGMRRSLREARSADCLADPSPVPENVLINACQAVVDGSGCGEEAAVQTQNEIDDHLHVEQETVMPAAKSNSIRRCVSQRPIGSREPLSMTSKPKVVNNRATSLQEKTDWADAFAKELSDQLTQAVTGAWASSKRERCKQLDLG